MVKPSRQDRGEAEQWLPAPGYELRYEVSSLGRIRSLPRVEIASNGVKRRVMGGMMRPMPNAQGYLQVSLRIDGKLKMVRFHRLIALAFHASGQNALHNEVAHLDGNRANARADNLKWVSKVENRGHRKLHGTECAGEAHGNAKLTAEAVQEIRSYPRGEADLKALAAKHGVSRRTVSSLRSGKGWHHLKPQTECRLSQGRATIRPMFTHRVHKAPLPRGHRRWLEVL